jgi:pimeloyl-ACP methyl ester carboxylesterase
VSESPTTGYAPVNGVQIYWESRGSGGVPLIVTHGGFGLTSRFGPLLDRLARNRRVIAIELQGHGHTRDIDRPFSYEAFGDDIGALVAQLELGRADLLGLSLGASASLRAAIRHPERVRRLIAISIPFRRDGWFAEVLEGMSHVSSAGFEQTRHSPMYASWLEVAPDPDGFPALMDKTGALLAQPYDWTEQVRALAAPTMLIYGDADSIPTSHAAEFFALLGGGLRDAGWRSPELGTARLAIIPGRSHYDIVSAPVLADIAEAFLD